MILTSETFSHPIQTFIYKRRKYEISPPLFFRRSPPRCPSARDVERFPVFRVDRLRRFRQKVVSKYANRRVRRTGRSERIQKILKITRRRVRFRRGKGKTVRPFRFCFAIRPQIEDEKRSRSRPNVPAERQSERNLREYRTLAARRVGSGPFPAVFASRVGPGRSFSQQKQKNQRLRVFRCFPRPVRRFVRRRRTLKNGSCAAPGLGRRNVALAPEPKTFRQNISLYFA